MRTGAIAAVIMTLASAGAAWAQDDPQVTRRPEAAQAPAPAAAAEGAEAGATAEGVRAPGAAAARPQPEVMDPVNAIERTFVAALTNPEMRPAFRRQLLESRVALAVSETDGETAPRTVPIQDGRRAVAIFTSAERLQAVLGEAAGFELITGREALERAGEQNVVLNFMWSPMLTLEPDDIASYLETPQTPAQSAPAAASGGAENDEN